MGKGSFAQLKRLVETESIDGIRLLENPGDNPICSLSYGETTRCLTIVWRKYATSAQLRFIHETIIQMLVQHKASKILSDDSDLPIIHAEDKKWITEDWLPRARAAGLRRPQLRYRLRFLVSSLSEQFTRSSLAKLRSKRFPIFTWPAHGCETSLSNPTAKPYLWSVGLGGRSGRTDQGACWSPARRH